ncbi:MAG: cell division ATP-binding protein FtsE [Candidatus Terrybacteria bacterium RIFCSPHIGHO2_01_FULL_48_17]|uniref:Cell division ATP-binding protein FtsE n=1 Tax=Candidatus Terrybacteria bacterium RIFCSPHIGHO2_01_FULL_48_17 TaxID=1802362 RepID=A0A1G2PJW0_9BACT|nr:MAG: cell division ATP-binding protein FtsE [Candidatus Terrybacteria bacterium RIFCSPHIGHO2_01_FULL_48_17]OHA53185.1 MAG: cell division ATP-binding protein FtsE [Candidatus Terrybacteria bacterium RIFCSPLOWO2_01_FULL_48_14]
MVKFEHATKRYPPNTAAAEDVTLTIAKDEFVSLVGRSGAGKSTLLKLLVGEEKPSSGKVFLGSTDVGELEPQEFPAHRRRIGAIFQDFRLLLGRNVFENVAFAMEVTGRATSEIKTVVPQALDLVGLAGKERRFPKELSGGEKQRVAIARALVHDPEVIMADEPTGNLDPVTAWDIVRLLERINAIAGTAVILATHDKDVVNALRKRVVVIDRGRIVRDDPEGRYTL